MPTMKARRHGALPVIPTPMEATPPEARGTPEALRQDAAKAALVAPERADKEAAKAVPAVPAAHKEARTAPGAPAMPPTRPEELKAHLVLKTEAQAVPTPAVEVTAPEAMTDPEIGTEVLRAIGILATPVPLAPVDAPKMNRALPVERDKPQGLRARLANKHPARQKQPFPFRLISSLKRMGSQPC